MGFPSCRLPVNLSLMSMSETRLATCMLCEAGCGVAVEIQDGRVATVRGTLTDAAGKILAHGTSSCLIMEMPK